MGETRFAEDTRRRNYSLDDANDGDEDSTTLLLLELKYRAPTLTSYIEDEDGPELYIPRDLIHLDYG